MLLVEKQKPGVETCFLTETCFMVLVFYDTCISLEFLMNLLVCHKFAFVEKAEKILTSMSLLLVLNLYTAVGDYMRPGGVCQL